MKSTIADPFFQRAIVTLCVRVWIEIACPGCHPHEEPVTLCVRVWIEMIKCFSSSPFVSVTLCVRVWIEILYALKVF